MKRWIVLLAATVMPLLGQARDHHQPHHHAQWEPEIAAFARADRAHPPAPGAVLFIGSSSIRLWTTLAADFPGIRTLNRGFGGSEIADSTYFADRIVAPYQPSAIVMYAGDNDLQDGNSPQQVLEDLQAFVRAARAVDPGVPIAFIAIKPSMARKALLPQIREANTKVRAWAATGQKVDYLDIFTPMLGADGQPKPAWFVGDGLHMNRTGYALWRRIVRPWVDRHGAHRPAR